MAEWHEEYHPRDDDGKFTFKNGGNQQSAKEKMQNRADVLYDSMDNKKIISSDKIDNTKFSDATWEKTRKFITGAEDFIPVAKRPLKDDVLTIGYGHTEGVKEGDTITREQAEELYKQDFSKYSTQLKYVTVPLNDNEKVALTSFIYNIGPTAFKNSTLLKKLNNGDKQGAADEFDKWIYKNGRKINGLINRREEEKKMFLKPDE